MTRISAASSPELPFPVVVMTGTQARVLFLRDIRKAPHLPEGSSYLIPKGKDAAVLADLNTRSARNVEGRWELHVQHLASDRQHIELFWINDGYAGGAYEATARSVAPLYRKITGPGFAFVFAGIALIINLALWVVVLLTIRAWRIRQSRPMSLDAEGITGDAEDRSVVMYRPTGPKELALVEESGFTRWPPRLPEQPIFYPVTNEEYAAEIAKKWNASESGVGYVTRFRVRLAFIQKFEVHQVGGEYHQEWWIPAEELEALNENIVGKIEVLREFRRR